MRTLPLLLLLAAFALSACDLLPLPPRDDDPRPHVPQPVVMVPAEDVPDERWPADWFTLNEGQIHGDVLSLSVTYSGGCKEHYFPLFAADAFAESNPVQARLVLAHEDFEDPCEAMPTERRSFHLGPLKQTYRHQYGRSDSTDVVILNVFTAHQPGSAALTLRYRF